MSQTDSNPLCDDITDNCDYIDLVDVTNLRYSKKDLLVMQLNIRGLMSKQDSLKQLLSEFHTPPDIVLLCETWLKNGTKDNIHIPGYKCYHKQRIDRLGGGVSILVKQQLRSRECTDLVIPTIHLEYNVVELKTNSNNVLLVSGYRPPNTNPKKIHERVQNCTDQT